MIGGYKYLYALITAKNKAKLTQYLMERRLFAHSARDCHGPSGLAMTFVSLLLCDPSTEFILSVVERTQGMLSGFVAISVI